MTLRQWGPLMDELDRLDCAAVIDARSIFGNLTEIDAYLLALRIAEMRRLRCQRLAVVTTDDPLPDLVFFINSVRNFGLDIESFSCVDTATAWAANQQYTEAELSLSTTARPDTN